MQQVMCFCHKKKTNVSTAKRSFKRTLKNDSNSDEVVVGLDLPVGKKSLPVQDVFENGEEVMDYYSQQLITIENQEAVLDTPYELVLLGRPSAE